MSNEKICPICSNKALDSDKFCMECGYKFPDNNVKNNIFYSNASNNSLTEEECVNIILDALNNEDFNRAIEYSDKLIKFNENSPFNWSLAANAFLIAGYYDKALTYVNKALSLDANFSFSWSVKANILSMKGDFDGALESCDSAIRLEPGNSDFIKLREDILNLKSFDFNSQNINHSFGSGNNDFDDFANILTEENLNLIINYNLTHYDYNKIMNNIKNIACNSNIKYKNNNMSILNKIRCFVELYAKVNYKAKGAHLGDYAFNRINVDDRLDDSQQIATLIHELAHHLLAEIFEQILMIIWNHEKTDAIEAFVWYALCNDRNFVLMNEYCAHTVEGRFIPFGYQNYGSFNNILQEYDIESDEVKDMVLAFLVLGNTFADDIINILEFYMDSNIRNEIKLQFKQDYNYPPNYEGILLETSNVFDEDSKFQFIKLILSSVFALIENNNFNMDVLEEFKNQFHSVNKMI